MADGALSVVALVLVALEAWLGPVPPSARAANLVAAPIITLPLVMRRRFPVAVALVILGGVKLEVLAGGSTANTIAPILPVSVAVYTMAVHAAKRYLTAGAAAAALLLLVAAGRVDDALFAGVLLAVPFALGLVVRDRQQRADRLQADAETAIAREQLRIARELHDVVAHSVGVMTVQAAAGRHVMHRSPEHAAEALQAIEDAGRQALAEMQRMVAILRQPSADGTLEPQPGLKDIQTLLERLQASGLEVSFELEPAAMGLPPGLDLTVYRIVQESLTNVIRHSNARHANVSVRRRGDEVEIVIKDPGPGRESASPPGHGLLGMHERAHLYGGRIETGPTPGGGYAVRAWLRVEG
jgi:signal transduction histidine kinase